MRRILQHCDLLILHLLLAACRLMSSCLGDCLHSAHQREDKDEEPHPRKKLVVAKRHGRGSLRARICLPLSPMAIRDRAASLHSPRLVKLGEMPRGDERVFDELFYLTFETPLDEVPFLKNKRPDRSPLNGGSTETFSSPPLASCRASWRAPQEGLLARFHRKKCAAKVRALSERTFARSAFLGE